MSVSWQFFETYGVISYGNGWSKDVVNQCLEFGTRQHSPYRHGADGLVCRVLLLCGHIPSASGMSSVTAVWVCDLCIWYAECYLCVGIYILHIHSAYTFCIYILHIHSAPCMASVTDEWAYTFCIYILHPVCRVLLLCGHVPSASGMPSVTAMWA